MIKIIMKKQVFFTKLSFRMFFCFVFGENFLKSSRQEVFYKKGFLAIMQNSQENTWASLFFNKVAGSNFFTSTYYVICSSRKTFKLT